MLGASAAALVSAGLVYWIGAGGDATLRRFGHAPAPAYAPPRADAGQVVRAYEQLKQVYADRGASGVADFARGCAESLAADRGALDYCVAFDIYSASVMGDDEIARAWRAGADERELALTRAAVAPTEDPIARLAEIRELARETSLQAAGPSSPAPKARQAPHHPKVRHAAHAVAPAVRPPAVQPPAIRPAAEAAAEADPRPAPEPAVQPAENSPSPPLAQSATTTVAEAKPRARPATVKKAAVKRARPPAASDACRRKATAGERTVCASPALRQADVQLQSAYRKAVAAGVDPQELARDQARFHRAVNAAAPDRVAVERLYYQRTRVLEGLSESP